MQQTAAIFALSLMTLFYASPASAGPRDCTRRLRNTPTDFCPSCLTATGTPAQLGSNGYCLSCLSPCYLDPVQPQKDDPKQGQQTNQETASCAESEPAEVLPGEALPLAVLVDAKLITPMEKEFPVAASFLAAVNWANKLSLIFDGRKLQVGFDHQPLKGNASAYLYNNPGAGKPGVAKELRAPYMVIATARASKLDDETLVMEINSELVSDDSSEKIEGPVFVLLRATGGKAVPLESGDELEGTLVRVASYSHDRALLK